jgi:hypothetical protein
MGISAPVFSLTIGERVAVFFPKPLALKPPGPFLAMIFAAFAATATLDRVRKSTSTRHHRIIWPSHV